MANAAHLRSKKAGLPPGSPMYVGNKGPEATKIEITGYDASNLTVMKDASVGDCAMNKDKFNVLWIDVVGLKNIKIISSLCENFGLHPLVIEDIFNTEQRPKVDVFEDYIFLTMRSYVRDEEHKYVDSEQVSLILGKNFLITIRENSSDIFGPIKNRLQTTQNIIRKKNADYLLYALIDIMVDSYFGIVENMGDRIEILEEQLTEKPNPAVIKNIHALKREMIYLRKSIWPLREVISGLHHRINGLIESDTILYLKDIYDHTIQVIDTIETYRDFLAGMLEVYLSAISNRLNEVMKVLTVFASIFIPLTFITSLYGMNFDTSSAFNMPELHWHYGYLYVWGIILLIVVGMMIFFKRKKWW